MERVILIGHGSPRREANNLELVARILHSRVHPGCDKGCVKISYLQFARPKISESIKECVEEGAGKITVLPYFLSDGMHVTKDIPRLIREAEQVYQGVEFVFAKPLGIHEKLVDVVLERLEEAGGLAPLEIEKESFRIISAELDLTGLAEEQLPIVKRVIHATADFEFRDSLLFHADAVQSGIKAIRAGKDILTDIEMVRTGINKRLLEKGGTRLLCYIREAEEPHPAEGSDPRTRAERGIERALQEESNIGIIVVGNAPTALLKVVELLNRSSFSDGDQPLVVGVPVGFVKALESKQLLSSQQFPFITNLSRKGGTPTAVAIVNALLAMAVKGVMS